VALPTEDWTWKQYEDAAVKIHKKLGIYGASFGKNIDFDIASTYISQHGEGLDIFNDDATGLGYTDDRMLADYFAMKVRLAKAGASPTPDVVLQIKDIEGDLIVSGKAAMTWVWSNQVVAMVKAAKRPLSMTVAPKLKTNGLSGMCVRASQAFSVPKTSKNKKEAMRFISYFLNDIETNKVLMGERGVPIMSTVRNALKPSLEPEVKQTFDFMDLVGRVASRPPYLEPIGQIEIGDLLNKTLVEPLGYGKMTPKEAAARFRQEATAVLKRTNK